MQLAEVIFIIKSFVTALMKRIKYIVYVHLSQETGKILYGKCTCKAGTGGCCKHVAAVLYHVLKFFRHEIFQEKQKTIKLYYFQT